MPNQGDPNNAKGTGPNNPPSDQELFRDLSSFRKETIKVSDQDKDKWREEANRSTHSGPTPVPVAPTDTSEKKEESRWDRIQREQRKKQIAGGLLVGCLVLLVIQSNMGGRLGSLFTRPVATPSATPAPPLVTSVDQQRLAEAFVVCRYEVRAFGGKPELKPLAEDPYRFDWSTLHGPACMFSPTRQTDPTERYRELSSEASPPARVLLVDQLARFVRAASRPAERLLADAITDEPAGIRARAAKLFEQQETFAQTQQVPDPGAGLLAAGIAELEPGGDPARARTYLERALVEIPATDPWPARALALASIAQGRAADAVAPLEKRRAANLKDELQGYQLAWLLVQAGRPADADKVLATLEELPAGEEARLLRAVRAAGAKDWAGYDAIAAKVEPDLAQKSPPFRARFQSLKAQALLARDPNQTPLARDLFLKTRELDPTCTWSDLSLARLLVKEKQLPEAASNYRRYLRRFPNAVAARRELASLLKDGSYFAQALGEYAELVIADGARDEYLKGIMFVGSAMGRPDLARYLLDRAHAPASH